MVLIAHGDAKILGLNKSVEGNDVSIDRTLWTSTISPDSVPNWPCPRCNATSLAVENGSFKSLADSATHHCQNDDDFEAEFTTGRFVCLLICSKSACRESCAVAGNFTISECGTHHPEYCTDGLPTAITPPPGMIVIPKACPKDIRSEIIAAFTLFWTDHASSLSRIRNAIELLLTAIGIKRKTRSGNGKLVRLTLDARIAILRSRNARMTDICERLLAVKHLGNAGSHPGGVGVDDVFDGLDILEQLLDDVYAKQSGTLAKMVKQINQRKGPRKKS